MSIISPTLLIDQRKCSENIQRMAQKATNEHLSFRPHFKTHQSAVVGEWFKNEGIDKCTVSSVKMAAYFADHNWNDILIAIPVNVLEYEDIDELAGKIKLSLLVENMTPLHLLSEKISKPVNIKIELDLGYGRSGLKTNQHEEIDELLKKIEDDPRFQFSGFYSHPGHTYQAKGKKEIEKVYDNAIEQLEMLKAAYGHLHGFFVTVGDTPGCSVMEDFGPIDEISPGNFVYYDLMQENIGSCTLDQISVVMACPVIGKNESENKLLIHGGAVHFSKEQLSEDNGNVIFGKVAQNIDGGWKGVYDESYLKSISQEHGIIHANRDLLNDTNIGDILYIYPIHSCLAANLMQEIDMLIIEG